MKKGVTLVEVIVVLAILATLCGLLAPLFFVKTSREDRDPPKTIQMVTVQHDEHWWILARESFVHHPDCPCRRRWAERDER